MAEEPDRIKEEIRSTRSDLARNVDALADRTIPTRVAQRRWSSMKEKVRGVSNTVMGTATDTLQDNTQQATGKAGEVAGAVTDTVQRAPDAVTRQTRGNPIAAGVIAFGVGLLTASLIPTTEVEKRAGQQLRENAGGLAEPVSESAQQLKGDLTGSVREAADRVRESARDAAQTTAEEARSSARDAGQQVRS
jgi:uncharacterized protein YjbJ (UPF0337 family)